MSNDSLIIIILLVAKIFVIIYYVYLEKNKYKELLKKYNFENVKSEKNEEINDYNSNNISKKSHNWGDFYIINNTSNSKGFLPQNWGPFAWMMLHSVALGYPDNPTIEDKLNYKMFYSNIKNILPCITCRLNFRKHSEQLNIDNYLTNSYTLHEWVTKIHNITASTYNGKQASEEKSRKYHLNWLTDPNFIAIDYKNSIFNKKLDKLKKEEETCESQCELKCNIDNI